jgi:hypothetical protein
MVTVTVVGHGVESWAHASNVSIGWVLELVVRVISWNLLEGECLRTMWNLESGHRI